MLNEENSHCLVNGSINKYPRQQIQACNDRRIYILLQIQRGITHVKHPEEDFLQLPAPFPNLVILQVILVALQVCDPLCPSGRLTFDHTMFDYVTWLNKSEGNLYYAYKQTWVRHLQLQYNFHYVPHKRC
jgi:hypothetical protein